MIESAKAEQVIRPKGHLVIQIERITKEYEMGHTTIRALKGVNLSIHRNEYLAVMGPSGSGKSTLMNMLGCLDTPTTGRYEFNGRDVAAMEDDEWLHLDSPLLDLRLDHVVLDLLVADRPDDPDDQRHREVDEQHHDAVPRLGV